MCIICVSKPGVRQPNFSEIVTMFTRNPHGAGYMYARDGKVHIHKGFMELGDLLDALKSERFTWEDSVVYHFRISTQAGINPEMTHPFPLSNQPRAMLALDVTCPCGVAHNGIIRLTTNHNEKRFSDTALFINQYMSTMIRRPSDLRNPAKLKQIYDLAQSKFAILDGGGYAATVGTFLNQDGLLFSNASFQSRF